MLKIDMFYHWNLHSMDQRKKKKNFAPTGIRTPENWNFSMVVQGAQNVGVHNFLKCHTYNETSLTNEPVLINANRLFAFGLKITKTRLHYQLRPF